MADKKDNTAYWCTCATDPNKCTGCAIERLVEQVLGVNGHKYLINRVHRIPQPHESRKVKRNN
jgi:hypothetical protein